MTTTTALRQMTADQSPKEVTTMTNHQPSPIREVPANEAGRLNLHGYESVCSCSLVIANTVRSNVEAEVREHLAYWEAKGR